MASLVLGVAGAAVGSYFGGPLGASIGWSIGSAVGTYLSQEDQKGPRRDDLRLQGSSYGTPIPLPYGTVRLAGNVIWQTDLQEHEETSGGKGGPETTTYTYSASFAVLLCEAPAGGIIGINRIWAYGRLIYGPGSPGDALPMTIYYGTEEQLPDPTMEAVEGVGNVPAHRGTAYVVFTDWTLTEFGDAIPQLSFEVICHGATSLEIYAEWPVDYDFPNNSSAYSYPYTLNGVETTTAGLTLHRYRSGNDYVGSPPDFPGDFQYGYEVRDYDLHGTLLASTAEVFVGVPYNVAGCSILGSINSGIAYTAGQITTDCTAFGGSSTTAVNTFQWLKDGAETFTPPNVFLRAGGASTVDLQLGISAAPLLWNGNVYACGGSVASELWVRRWPAPDGACYTEAHDAECNLRLYSHDSFSSAPFDLTLGDDGYLYCCISYFGGASPDPEVIGGWGIRLLRFNADLTLLDSWLDTLVDPEVTPGRLPVPGYSSLVVYRGHLIAYYSSGDNHVFDPCFILYKMEANHVLAYVDEVVVPGVANDDSPPVYSFATPLVSLQNGFAAFRGGILRLGGGGILLSEIVADVSRRAGYTADQYDVTPLTDIVKGYTVSDRMNARSAIDALRPCYQFGAVESNLQVKFVKWSGDIDATIPDADLGARPADDDAVVPFEVTRMQEADLPQQVSVTYINYGMDYQDGQQLAQRSTTQSELRGVVSIPVVLDDAEARRVTDVLLFNGWMERDRFRFQLPRKWAHLEPTDVLSIGGRSVRISNKEEHGYTHIAFDGYATGVNVFVNAPVAVPPVGFVPPSPPIPNRTDLVLLDLPLVTDADAPNGYYAAVAGRAAGAWPGAALFKSIDGGASYTSIGATTTNNSIGVATTALADWTGGNVVDEVSTVTVRLTPGSPDLSSTTRTGMLNGANLAALGVDDAWEVFQYQTATLIAERTYTLSALLRGRRGTNWATGGHLIGDTFVALPVQNVAGPGAELGQERLFKAVTTGMALSTAIATAFTNEGVALKPYAPEQIGGGRNGSGNITINWVRRTRIGGVWLDYTDVPLSEATEGYIITVYTTSGYAAIARIGLATVETLTYTAAEQTTDFGSPQSTIYVGVQQIGGYGYGYEGRGSV